MSLQAVVQCYTRNGETLITLHKLSKTLKGIKDSIVKLEVSIQDLVGFTDNI